jgi:hypothetical protein
MAGDSPVAVLDIVWGDVVVLSDGLDMAAPPPTVDELPPEDGISRSPAQPPTINPKKVSQIMFLSMEAPPVENG